MEQLLSKPRADWYEGPITMDLASELIKATEKVAFDDLIEFERNIKAMTELLYLRLYYSKLYSVEDEKRSYNMLIDTVREFYFSPGEDEQTPSELSLITRSVVMKVLYQNGSNPVADKVFTDISKIPA